MDFEELSDEALLQCARDGQDRAFSTLCSRHFELVYRVSYRLVGNSSDADDVTQEVLLRVAKHIRSFRGTSKVTTWLYRVTTNAACDFLRQQKRLHRSKDAMKSAIEIEDHNQGKLSESVRDALAVLSEPDRAAIVLTYFEGLSHAETAKILECAETTVSWRIFKAKKKLKKILMDEEAYA